MQFHWFAGQDGACCGMCEAQDIIFAECMDCGQMVCGIIGARVVFRTSYRDGVMPGRPEKTVRGRRESEKYERRETSDEEEQSREKKQGREKGNGKQKVQ